MWANLHRYTEVGDTNIEIIQREIISLGSRSGKASVELFGREYVQSRVVRFIWNTDCSAFDDGLSADGGPNRCDLGRAIRKLQ